MVHRYSAKGVKRYRYYVCYRAQRSSKNCKTKSVPPPAIESAVLEPVRRLGTAPQLAAEVIH
jgi:hypothetical protein